MPPLAIVAAVARNGVIGARGGLPWRLPDDLKHNVGQLTYGLKGSSNDTLRQQWLATAVPFCEKVGVRVGAAATLGSMWEYHVYPGTRPAQAKLLKTVQDPEARVRAPAVRLAGDHDAVGRVDRQSEHDVDPNAKVTLNGNKAKMADLKPGDQVAFSGNPAKSVSATR